MGYNYYFELVSSVFLGLMLVSVQVRRRDTARHSTVFRLLVLMLIIAAFLDILTAILIDNQSLVPIPLNKALNAIYFAIFPLCAYFFLLYILSYRRLQEKVSKTITVLSTGSYVIFLILSLVNLKVGFIFTFKNGYYEHGPLVLIVQFYALTMMLIAFVILLTMKKRFTRRQFYPLALYSPLIMIGSVAQTFVIPNVLLIYFLAHVGAFIIYLFLETPDYQKLQKTLVALSEAEREAAKANNAKSEFLSQMSHEIRTPINAVLGMNEMIIREATEPAIRHYAEDVKAAGSSLLSLVNDILDFSKIEAGKLSLIPENYHLSSLIYDLMVITRSSAESKGLELNVLVDNELPEDLSGDDTRIRQVILNLLTNAVKYTNEGSVTLSFSLDREMSVEGKAAITVHVTDTGIGIKKEDMDILFSPFDRLEEDRNRNVEGTGLGMSIVKSLLSMMDSDLSVVSKYGKGSDFYFTILQDITGPELIGNFEERVKKQGRKTEDASFTAEGASLLVVDDTPVNIVVFTNLLKRTHASIDSANSGYEACEKAQDKKYDIIFMDHRMPGMDGTETMLRIKQSEGPNKTTPIIVLTATAISGMREKFLEYGFDDYLSKPVDPKKLEPMVRKYLPESMVTEAEAEEEENPLDSSFLVRLREVKGLDVSAGIRNCGDASAYETSIRLFASNGFDNLREIRRTVEERDINNFTIRIHSLKTAARIVGAVRLSIVAGRLEGCGDRKDEAGIELGAPGLMKSYEELINSIEALRKDTEEDYQGRKPITASEFDDACEALRECAMSFDLESVDNIIGEIRKYSLNETDAAFITEISRSSMAADSDGIVKKIDERMNRSK